MLLGTTNGGAGPQAGRFTAPAELGADGVPPQLAAATNVPMAKTSLTQNVGTTHFT